MRRDAYSALYRWEHALLTRYGRIVVLRRGASASRRIASMRNRKATPIVSGRADDVAVVPADAYEYRHLLNTAQP
jgi:hypothetical protein